jgi:aconitate hydratase
VRATGSRTRRISRAPSPFPASDPPSSHDDDGRYGGDGADPDAGSGTGGAQVAERVSTRIPLTLADGTDTELDHGHVVIAAITSCTNTSNPSVMLGAGLLARNAVAKGLTSKPWVKTSLAPGSKVVTEYLERAGLTEDLEALGFHLVGYGCTTCIGNSGPLPEEISNVVGAEDLAVVSVLSGNRNFEGRINPDVKMNYLASPPLVVAYALAGTMDIDLLDEPLGTTDDGEEVFLADIWPSSQEVAETVEYAVQSDMFRSSYDEVFDGDERWNSLEIPTGDRFAWDPDSTYVRLPPYFKDLPREPERSWTSRAPGCSPCSATPSRRTTSHPRARSRRTARRRATSTNTAWRTRTSTPTAPAAATTR